MFFRCVQERERTSKGSYAFLFGDHASRGTKSTAGSGSDRTSEGRTKRAAPSEQIHRLAHFTDARHEAKEGEEKEVGRAAFLDISRLRGFLLPQGDADEGDADEGGGDEWRDEVAGEGVCEGTGGDEVSGEEGKEEGGGEEGGEDSDEDADTEAEDREASEGEEEEEEEEEEVHVEACLLGSAEEEEEEGGKGLLSIVHEGKAKSLGSDSMISSAISIGGGGGGARGGGIGKGQLPALGTDGARRGAPRTFNSDLSLLSMSSMSSMSSSSSSMGGSSSEFEDFSEY